MYAKQKVYLPAVLFYFAVVLAPKFIGLVPLASVGVISQNPILLAALTLAGMLFAFLVQLTGLVGLVCIGVKDARGETIKISNIFQPLANFGPSAACAGLILVPIIVLTLALLGAIGTNDAPVPTALPPVPTGLGLAAISLSAGALIFFVIMIGPFILAATHCAMTGANAWTSLRSSFKKLGPHMLSFAALLFLAFLASGLGAIRFYVGMVVTFTIGTNVIALHYTYFFPIEEPAIEDKSPV